MGGGEREKKQTLLVGYFPGNTCHRSLNSTLFIKVLSWNENIVGNGGNFLNNLTEGEDYKFFLT